MEMDIKRITQQLEELVTERENLDEKIRLLNEEKENLENYDSYENEDEFIKKTVRKTAKNKIKRINEKLKGIDKRLGEIFEKEISLTKEKNLLKFQANNIMKSISSVNSEIMVYNLKIRQFEELLDKSKRVGTNEEIIDLINKQYEDLIKERDEKKKILDQFKYEGSIIFDSSKKKVDEPEEITKATNDDVEIQTIEENIVPIVDLKEQIEEQSNEEVKIQTPEVNVIPAVVEEHSEQKLEEANADSVSEEPVEDEETTKEEVSIVPVYPKEEHLAVVPSVEEANVNPEDLLADLNKSSETSENEDENTSNKKHSFGEIMKSGYEAVKGKVIDVTQEAVDKMKKRVKLIKHIPNWLKGTGKDVMVAGIVAITYLLVSPYIGQFVAPMVAGASTFGKGR